MPDRNRKLSKVLEFPRDHSGYLIVKRTRIKQALKWIRHRVPAWSILIGIFESAPLEKALLALFGSSTVATAISFYTAFKPSDSERVNHEAASVFANLVFFSFLIGVMWLFCQFLIRLAPAEVRDHKTALQFATNRTSLLDPSASQGTVENTKNLAIQLWTYKNFTRPAARATISALLLILFAALLAFLASSFPNSFVPSPVKLFSA